MFPPGHVGIALALYAPVGLVLLLRGRPRLAVAGTVLVAGTTMLPDVDTSLPWFVHRGRTHTVWFALAAGISLGAIAAVAGGAGRQEGAAALGYGAFGLAVGTLAVLAHLVGDVITPMGVRPLYPLSDAGYTFGLVFASDPTANARLFALGCLVTVTQFALGIGAAPGTRGRATLRGAFRPFVDALGRWSSATPDRSPGPRVAEPSIGPAESVGRGGQRDD